MGKDKAVNVHTNSHYAFAMAHVHRAIYREGGLLTAEGKTIKNKQKILDLLSAFWLPKSLAIILCPGHQKGYSYEAQGNRRSDHAATEATLAASELLIKIADLMLTIVVPRL